MKKYFKLKEVITQYEIVFKKNVNINASFSWMGFNCLKVTDPLGGDSLLFTTKSPEIHCTHLINFGKMKG